MYIDKTQEIIQLREKIRGWRFYDYFRSDKDAPARLPQLGTHTPVLSQNEHDLATALQTIIKIGDRQAFKEAIEDAFSASRLEIKKYENSPFIVELYQEGLLRALSVSEFHRWNFTLFILWVAVLLNQDILN
ncbi:MAG: hypothetical protein AB8V03_00020 [Francisella endosymbiont of Hyalomma asiaticum]